jgi:hypothetical protein
LRNISVAVYALYLSLAVCASASAQDDKQSPWPKEIPTARGTLVMYQPQPDSLEGNVLRARAAVAFELEDADVPVFGAVWFAARLVTDRAERTATLADITVERSRFPDQDDAKSGQLKTLLETEIPKWNISISMERLLATLDIREQQIDAVNQISTDPPVILFYPEPAILVTLDGEARLSPVEGTDLMRVMNTPFTLLLDSGTRSYFLNADAESWYTAADIKGEWQIAQTVPREVAALAPQPDPEDDGDFQEESFEPGPAPKVVVVTEPTELISASGKPEYTPIENTELLSMSNTDSDVLLSLADQRHYVLLAGRWFAATSMDGPWEYVAGEDLPQDFASIPEDSQMGTVLYAVPGTALAEEAVLDAQVPQTATIERDKAALEVEYDGEPEFEDIEETDLKYAANSPTPVIQVGSEYYAVDEAVWFVSSRPTGPWAVATVVPQAIYTMPPTSPVYYVTYVHIYDYTDDVVYVGYLPGYTGTYVYQTTIVYGTGFYYPGWYRRYYYPRYSTWGFHVRYNPWGGWSFGFSYSSGPFTFYVGRGSWYRGGWWGPSRYRGYRHGYRHGYRRGARAGYRAGYRAGQRNAAQRNLYNSSRNQARSTAQSQARNQAGGNQLTARSQSQAARPRNNNVYADRDGNVHRRTDQGWEQRSGNGWQSEGQRPSSQPGASQPGTPQNQPTQRPQNQQYSRPSSMSGGSSSYQQLNRSHTSRQHGAQRSNSYNQVRRGGRRR